MTRNLIYAAAGLLALSGQAMAADMAVKAARPAPLPLFYGGSGTYCGMEAGAAQTKIGQTTVAGSPVAGTGIYAAGGTVSLTCGWTQALSPDRWAAIDASLNATNADLTATTGTSVISVNRRFSFDLTGMYGAKLDVLSGLLSNASNAFGALPPTPCAGAGCIASNVHPFILAGLHYGQTAAQVTSITAPGLVVLEDKHNKLRFDLGVGTLVQLNPSTVWRTTARWTFGSQDRGAGFLFIPGAPVSDGGTLTAKTGLIYDMSKWLGG